MRQVLNNYIFQLTPFFGIALFLGLYFYSTILYPGGSQTDQLSIGFSWIDNYLCNLVSETALNGEPNLGRPFALAGILILCLSLLIFFVQFAHAFSKNKPWKYIISVSGVFSMLISMFIFTPFHDSMTILASIFGLVTIVGIVRELFLNHQISLLLSGLFCLIILGINNYIYYTKEGLAYLPLLQKLSMLFILTWIVAVNSKMIREVK